MTETVVSFLIGASVLLVIVIAVKLYAGGK